MPNTKITELAELQTLPTNNQNLLLIAVDTSPLVPVTRKLKFSTLYDYIDNLTLQSYAHANSAFDRANTSLRMINLAPTSPKGNTGDVAGMVHMSNTYFYYCTSSYNGTSNIWSRISSTDSW